MAAQLAVIHAVGLDQRNLKLSGMLHTLVLIGTIQSNLSVSLAAP